MNDIPPSIHRRRLTRPRNPAAAWWPCTMRLRMRMRILSRAQGLSRLYRGRARTQARKRVMQLSIFFAVLMGVVVTRFPHRRHVYAAQHVRRPDQTARRRLAAKESPVPQPVVVSAPAAPAPDPHRSSKRPVREISKAATELRTSLDKNGRVSDIAAKVHDRVAAQDSELGKLREELKKCSRRRKVEPRARRAQKCAQTVTQPAGPARVATPAAILGTRQPTQIVSRTRR
jgi:hypothetical protein